MRRMFLGIVVVSICAALSVGVWADTQSASLTRWEMTLANSFPGGIALDEGGLVYTVTNSGMQVIRLDPANSLYRSWGVSEHPQDVAIVDGIVFCTIRGANHISYLNPEGTSTSTSLVPFPDAGLGELHRGPDTAGGNIVFWIAEPAIQGLLRFEYNPADPPRVTDAPSDYPATQSVSSISPVIVPAEYERFSYDIRLITDPFPAAAPQTSPPYTQWQLPLGDDRWLEDLAVADDGTLWVSFGTPLLIRFDPVASTIQLLETIQNVAIFQGLLPAADGSIWFGNIVDGSIGHLNPVTGLSEVWRIPGTGEVYDLAFDADGAIWYTDRVGEAIGRLDTLAGEATVYRLAEESEPLYLEIDSAGDVWFTAGYGNYIGRLTLAP